MALFYLPEFSLSGEKTVQIHMSVGVVSCERLTDNEILDCSNEQEIITLTYDF